jgi:hypothetical protein
LKSEKESRKTLLEKEGWERKFVIEEHRVDEYVELYESLNQEVLIEPVIPGEMEGCAECFKANCTNYRIIYTRVKY